MKIKTILASAVAFILTSHFAYADSPLTSTYFADLYHDEEIVVSASKSEGIITEDLMEYLLDKKNTIDVKLAVINELGWSLDGKNNAEIFLKYLKAKRGYSDATDLKNNGKRDELICMAYLLALDDYFNITEALEFANLAIAKSKNSYACHLIAGIIKAQSDFDVSWCAVYKATDTVRKNTNLKMDFKAEASDRIFEYMDLYNDDCE